MCDAAKKRVGKGPNIVTALLDFAHQLFLDQPGSDGYEFEVKGLKLVRGMDAGCYVSVDQRF